MKHIVFVVGNYKNGGVPMRTTNLANEFAKKGYTSTILVTKDISENVFFERHKNVNLVSLKEYASKNAENDIIKRNREKRNKRIKALKLFRYASKFIPSLDKILAREIRGLRRSEKLSTFIVTNPDCIYIPFGASYFETVFYAAKGTNWKILYAERNAPELEFPSDASDKKHIFKMLSKIDGAVLQTKDELEFFGDTIKNAVVINNPVKANLPEPYVGERRKTVVNFCRISKQKNIPLMINAFIEFHKSHPDYTLEIYGNTVEKIEDDLKQEYIEMILSLNADKHIRILPPRADVHSVIRDCAMFVSSSDFEGLSNSMIEAMAIGLPCVCTDCLGGGAREVITNGKNGLLVPMNDVTALANAMKKMAEDSELSEKCSQNAAKIRDKLSAETIAGKWLDVIESI